MKRILVDMDGVIADYSGEFKRRWDELHPNKPLGNWDSRRYHDIDENYPHHRYNINEIITSNPFFYTLPPIPGAIEGLQRLSKNHEVYLCSAPSIRNESCASAKMVWVKNFLGYKWLDKTILTRDKTLIDADYLIDDKPQVTGARMPSWEHLVFRQPYNRHVTNKRRVCWDSIDGVLEQDSHSSCARIVPRQVGAPQ